MLLYIKLKTHLFPTLNGYIFKSIIENKGFDDYWSNHCKDVEKEILTTKLVQKPYEDVNDAYVLYKYLEMKSL